MIKILFVAPAGVVLCSQRHSSCAVPRVGEGIILQCKSSGLTEFHRFKVEYVCWYESQSAEGLEAAVQLSLCEDQSN